MPISKPSVATRGRPSQSERRLGLPFYLASWEGGNAGGPSASKWANRRFLIGVDHDLKDLKKFGKEKSWFDSPISAQPLNLEKMLKVSDHKLNGRESPKQTFIFLPKHDQSLMIWGAVNLDYKSLLIFVGGIFNVPRHQDLLKHHDILWSIRVYYRELLAWFQQYGE
jgi:hypothetical protein